MQQPKAGVRDRPSPISPLQHIDIRILSFILSFWNDNIFFWKATLYFLNDFEITKAGYVEAWKKER